jgi:hypothetical protein
MPNPVTSGEPMKPSALLERLVKEGIEPNANAVAEIAARGEIAVVVFEPSDEWKDALRVHGWTGEAVFPMSEWMRRAMSTTDLVTERWVAGPRPKAARIFAVIDDDSLLVNKDARGFSIEPGSLEEGTLEG